MTRAEHQLDDEFKYFIDHISVIEIDIDIDGCWKLKNP